MRLDNYISFSIVVGFFFGIIISVIKFDSPEMIVLFTFFVTIGFYLITLFFASFYMIFFDFKRAKLDKKRHDATLEYFVSEFDKRERIVDKIREFLRTIDFGTDDDPQTQPKVQKGKYAA